MLGMGGVGALAALGANGLVSSAESILTSAIGGGEQRIPKLGMGSWITFDVTSASDIEVRRRVLETFFALGGRMVDSSPMYGSSERVIGQCLSSFDQPTPVFSAGKIWIPGAERGVHQVNYSKGLWGIDRFDLMQVHNMVDWQTHLKTLRTWKEQGEVLYSGITTSHGRRHDDLFEVLRREPFDFVQLTYNIYDREAEQRLLPMALEKGISVIANRPFKTGALFSLVEGKPLPGMAKDIACQNWAQFFLKFVVSHPAITCAIPATSQVAHMQQNMAACYGQLPDANMRRQMLAAFQNAL